MSLGSWPSPKIPVLISHTGKKSALQIALQNPIQLSKFKTYLLLSARSIPFPSYSLLSKIILQMHSAYSIYHEHRFLLNTQKEQIQQSTI